MDLWMTASLYLLDTFQKICGGYRLEICWQSREDSRKSVEDSWVSMKDIFRISAGSVEDSFRIYFGGQPQDSCQSIRTAADCLLDDSVVLWSSFYEYLVVISGGQLQDGWNSMEDSLMISAGDLWRTASR